MDEKEITEKDWELFDSGNYRIHSSRIKKAKSYYSGEWVEPLLKFMFGNLIWVIPVCIWGLVANDGWKTIVFFIFLYCFLAIVLARRADVVSEGMMLDLMAIKYYGSKSHALQNTLNYAWYIIPRLKECEKQTNPEKEKELYNKLIADMDEKVGKGNHIIGPPFNEEDKKRRMAKRQAIIDAAKREEEAKNNLLDAEAQAWKDLGDFAEDLITGYDELIIALKNNDILQEKIFYRFLRMIVKYSLPAKKKYSQKDEDWWYKYEQITRPIIGDDFPWTVSNWRRIGLGSLYYVRAMQVYTMRKWYDAKDYFTRQDKNGLPLAEAMLIYKFMQKVKPYMKHVQYTEIDKKFYDEACKKENSNCCTQDVCCIINRVYDDKNHEPFMRSVLGVGKREYKYRDEELGDIRRDRIKREKELKKWRKENGIPEYKPPKRR